MGASSEIGRAIARRLTVNGTRVFGVSHEAASAGTDMVVHESVDCTVSDEVAAVFRRAKAELGRLDTVVTAAAVSPRARAAETTDEQWNAALSSTLTTAFLAGREALRYLERGGSITAVSSVVADRGSPGYAAYSAAKGGLNSLVRVLALECGARGIRVNAVAPGLIGGAELPDAARGYALGHTGEPDDVAAAVEFLSSPAAGFITGVVLPVDGGLSAASPVAFLRPDLVDLLR
ncbi:SDR family NAD(P)-dependent oxidoreductase [Jiangella asiatica]|uniref:SDR family NAD(P)-dependent oxidoreductase n=1 Tax=Jiangella asiatica TaxID=2530372 RepID=UPI001EEFF258|nr:SDR family oxidoreductase [Jiangella asiatica]